MWPAWKRSWLPCGNNKTPEVSREELEALRGENTRLKAQIEELEAQLTEPEAPVGDQTNWKDEELAAYRRAETVERQARNRAAQMYHRVNGLIATWRPGWRAARPR